MKEELIRKFVEKLDYSYSYKTVNERNNIIKNLYEIAGIKQCHIADVVKSVCPHEWDEGHNNVSKCKKCGKYSA